MAYRITINGGKSWVEVQYHGYVDLSQKLQAVSEVIEILKQGQADNRLLIDVTRIKSALRPIEEFNLAEKLVSTEELRDTQVALLKKPGSDEYRLLSITAINRGLDLKEFIDRNEAVRWLQE